MNKGLIYQFAFDYTDRNRSELTKYKSFEVFDKNFRISPAIYSQFESFAVKKGVKKTSVAKNDTDEKIKNLLKSLISRNLFDDKGFYPIYLKTDPTFLKALEVLKIISSGKAFEWQVPVIGKMITFANQTKIIIILCLKI